MIGEASRVPAREGSGLGVVVPTNYSLSERFINPSPSELVRLVIARGCLSEIELFEMFDRRRKALKAVRVLTSGQYRWFDSRVEYGQRIFYPHRQLPEARAEA